MFAPLAVIVVLSPLQKVGVAATAVTVGKAVTVTGTVADPVHPLAVVPNTI